jgi:hypothetical protein
LLSPRGGSTFAEPWGYYFIRSGREGDFADASLLCEFLMKTLYELIGALPEDDADELRAAFRKAVKANHPDLNPDDPEAAREFRRIIRANAILSDPRQREAYDRLLDNARRQQRITKRARLRRLGLDVTVGVVALMLFIGGYYLLRPIDRLSVPKSETSRFEPQHTVAVRSTELSSQDRAEHDAGRTEIVGARAGQTDLNPKHDFEPTDVATLAPGAMIGGVAAVEPAAPPQETAEHGSAPRDVSYYRSRAAAAYRGGDLSVALVNLDLAIQQDTNCSDCYVDRGIVLHRMGHLQAAFADVAEARRIEARNRTHSEARSH